ncbi:MAG: NUDIX hydrolase [bacterium]|nr:NUDIX hydrolase [bacterium]
MTLPLNFYRSTKEKPYHLSVGCIVVNEKGEMLTRHFKVFHGKEMEIFLFPTETIEQHETLEETFHRGLLEEVGVQAEIISFIGSLMGPAQSGDKVFEKTVVYFLGKIISISDPLTPNEDGMSTIEWHTPEFLLEHVLQQADYIQTSVLNEEKVIRTAQEVLRMNKDELHL